DVLHDLDVDERHCLILSVGSVCDRRRLELGHFTVSTELEEPLTRCASCGGHERIIRYCSVIRIGPVTHFARGRMGQMTHAGDQTRRPEKAINRCNRSAPAGGSTSAANESSPRT